jgi:uncharacterized membrane protein
MNENTPEPMYCANHPGVETTLRCNKCGKPICAKCAVRTPTGYRCKECVRGQQKIFNTAVWLDFILGFITAWILSFIASFLVYLISGITGIFAFIIVFFAAPSAGMVIAEAVRYATRKHRSHPLFITVSVGVVLGALPLIFYHLLFAFNLFGLIFQGIFLVMAVPVIYTRLSGIQLSR